MFLKDCRDLLMFQCIKEIRSRVEITSPRRQEGMDSRAQVELACKKSPPSPFQQDGGRRGVCGSRSACGTRHW